MIWKVVAGIVSQMARPTEILRQVDAERAGGRVAANGEVVLPENRRTAYTRFSATFAD